MNPPFSLDTLMDWGNLAATDDNTLTAALRTTLSTARQQAGNGNITAALASYAQLQQQCREAETGYLEAAALCLQQGKSFEALSQLSNGFEQAVRTPRMLYLLSEIEAGLGHIDAAEAATDELLQQHPDFEIGLANKASYLGYRGDYDAARALLEPLMKRKEPGVSVLLRYARFAGKFGVEKKAQAALIKALQRKTLKTGQRASLHFRVAQLSDRARQYDAAFYHAQKANELLRGDSGVAAIRQFIDTLLSHYPEGHALADSGNDSRQPIFIVGMPRSGTSLTEQILSAHPAIAARGELQLIKQSAAGFYHELGCAYPACAAQLSPALLQREAQRYLQQTLAADAPERYTTDKLPHNFLYLGLIRQLFPQAKIIHVQRHPLDISLSCYMQNFSGQHRYSHHLADLAEYYLEYRRIMQHWQRLIPMFDLHYETLVQDTDAVVRDLLDYLALPWDDACLAFNTVKGVMATASSEQVRSGMYTQSLNRRDHYKRHLKPAIKVFEAAGLTL